MDKEKEVKRYSLESSSEGSTLYPNDKGDWVDYSDWKAERTKREIAEKWILSYKEKWYSACDKIKKLEAEATAWASKVGELKDQLATVQKRLKGYEDAPNRLINILDLEMEIATANAKIGELEKRQGCNHDNLETIVHLFEKVRTKCKDCGKTTFPTFEAEQEAIDRIRGLQAELSTANKKAEKLVEVLEFVLDKISDEKGRNNPDNYILNTTITKAIKEVRGESNG